MFGAVQCFQLGVFPVNAQVYISRGQGKSLADKSAAQAAEFGAGKIAYGAHAQWVAEHLEAALEPSHLQAVGNVIATAPMVSTCLVAGLETVVARSKVQGIDMRLELGPTGKTQLPGDLPLGLGQGGAGV